ncbi:hypothetical protein [Fimbriimonas ginsengisoli]|nr:hypothetical protein [Fimbriimonas ginsengisoli]
MKNERSLLIALLLVGTLTTPGCSKSEAGTMTKAQEEAARHPVADPTYKGPTEADRAAMVKSIEDYQNKHKNDKIEFNTPK